MSRRYLWSIALAVFAFAWPALAARADDPKLSPPKKDTLDAVLQRIREHAAGEAWKQPGFQDDEIEKWLDKLIGSIAKASEINDLKLPVRLTGVRPRERLQPRAGGTSMLWDSLAVCHDADWKDTSVQRSIILASGDVDVDVVRDSVIVAGGVITIHGSSEGSVFVAGTMVILGEYDGSAGRDERGSVVVSRGWADLGERAHGTIVAAQKGISAVSTEGAVIVNGPLPATQRGAAIDIRGRSVRVADLPLESHVIHPLSTKIKVTGVMHGPVKTSASQGGRVTVAPAAAIIQLDGRRYVADLGQPILDEAGKPVAALADWKLHAITTSQAVFSKPDAGIVLPIDAQ
jgi:hypothetical protein